METETCQASVERVKGHLLRIHPGEGVYGAPFFATCLVIPHWGRCWWRWWTFRRPLAEVKALLVRGDVSRVLAMRMGRAIHRTVRQLGYRRLFYDRRLLDALGTEDDMKRFDTKA